MQVRYATNPTDAKNYTTHRLREDFLIEALMDKDNICSVYSHYDRVVIGGAMPVTTSLFLQTYDPLKADFFLERREMGIINVGGDGSIQVGTEAFILKKRDCLYVGLGNKEVSFHNADANNPARFFFMSTPAHKSYPTQKMSMEEASPVDLGSKETANERTIYKYIHSDGLKSCQLVMGLTILKTGSVWNTMPAHVHDRRMEVYFYFDLPENARVIHFMGQPQETRHLVVANEQLVISPPWSIHSGSGTSNYSFIWAMAGENYTFTDMDFVDMKDLR